MENSHSKAHISALIFDLDGTLLNTEQLTNNILKEFLAKYGKVQDNDKEKKRLGVTFKELSIAIVNDYHLPLTPQQYIHEILPMYHGKFLEAAKGMGVDPSHCLVIEDSLVGVKAGKAAGKKVVAVPSLQIESDSYSISDSVLHSLLEFQPELWGLPQFEDYVEDDFAP